MLEIDGMISVVEAGILVVFLYQNAISLTFAFSHHPQAVDDHVSRRMNGAPGVLAGDVFDEGRIASAGLVEDLDLHPFGEACLQPVPFLFVAWFLALAHVAEETGLIRHCLHPLF